MQIEKTVYGKLHENCYMISSGKAAVVIDPGAKDLKTLEFLSSASDKERLILLTHCHFDHIGGAEYLREKTGVKIAIGAIEAPCLEDPYYTLSDRFYANVAPFKADIMLSNGQSFSVGDIDFKAFLTPGHTKGGMCYFADGCLFSGDTLFKGTAGRTDLPGGSSEELFSSLNKITESFSDDTEVYPGHGYKTDIKTEKLYNPYINGEIK